MRLNENDEGDPNYFYGLHPESVSNPLIFLNLLKRNDFSFFWKKEFILTVVCFYPNHKENNDTVKSYAEEDFYQKHCSHC